MPVMVRDRGQAKDEHYCVEAADERRCTESVARKIEDTKKGGSEIRTLPPRQPDGASSRFHMFKGAYPLSQSPIAVFEATREGGLGSLSRDVKELGRTWKSNECTQLDVTRQRTDFLKGEECLAVEGSDTATISKKVGMEGGTQYQWMMERGGRVAPTERPTESQVGCDPFQDPNVTKGSGLVKSSFATRALMQGSRINSHNNSTCHSGLQQVRTPTKSNRQQVKSAHEGRRADREKWITKMTIQGYPAKSRLRIEEYPNWNKVKRGVYRTLPPRQPDKESRLPREGRRAGRGRMLDGVDTKEIGRWRGRTWVDD
ncbi:hypothetical protein EDB85DRAFT_1904546 [Lactarius pseudohatsudake]|nr:hypothetical protein EDB85DRAFT_1904546 [Lactarius pseudohatsudake]